MLLLATEEVYMYPSTIWGADESMTARLLILFETNGQNKS